MYSLLPNFASILPISNRICPNFLSKSNQFQQQENAAASPAPTALSFMMICMFPGQRRKKAKILLVICTRSCFKILFFFVLKNVLRRRKEAQRHSFDTSEIQPARTQPEAGKEQCCC